MDRSGHNPFEEEKAQPLTWLQRQQLKQRQQELSLPGSTHGGPSSHGGNISGENDMNLSTHSTKSLPPPKPQRAHNENQSVRSQSPTLNVASQEMSVPRSDSSKLLHFAKAMEQHNDSYSDKGSMEGRPSNSLSLQRPVPTYKEGISREGSRQNMLASDQYHEFSQHSDVDYKTVMTTSPIHKTQNKEAAESLPKTFINYNVAEGNLIYHKITYSQGWVILALVFHIGQWSVLLSVGQRAMPRNALYLLLVLVITVTILLLYTRYAVTRTPRRFELFSKEEMTPDNETDIVPPRAVYALALAALMEGFCFAVFSVLTAGTIGTLDTNGFYTSETLLQCMQFASVTLLTFHRIIRPANRCDPMRTVLELEVVSVCWGALDGATIIELVDGRNLSPETLAASQFLMVFWYLSVGARMATMICILLPPTEYFYKLVSFQPFQLASQPTVDRTMQGLRIRSNVILAMASAELYAAGLRIALWSQGLLDSIQQDMALKNLLFLSSVYSAYCMRNNTIKRDWNDRELAFGILLPHRSVQLRICRIIFLSSYILQGVLMSVSLSLVTKASDFWILNVITDVFLALVFFFYCRNVHRQNVDTSRHRLCLPRQSYVIFPAKMAIILSSIMMINLYAVRIPALYYHAKDMSTTNSGTLDNYNSALLIVNASIIVIGSLAMYWSIAYMIFKKDFTASPGNYNAIHDPTISMVASSIQIEAALDVLSCTTLMALATSDLPPSINGAIVLFALLELFNAFQSFGLQVILSGGHDDTPADLVRWKAMLRLFRFVVDFGCLILRLDLWIQYNALSSVFLIKNLYNLLNAVSQVERNYGVDRYPQATLFTEFVPPNEWYAMSKEMWRYATQTDGAQSAITAGRI